ncbi:MAG: TIM barrel protein [Verrucomicrobia bacterium]|jgi:hypothetical protein|nr:MAG: TIM barrel protein [Verrucomicrobiota bacterium]
MILNHGLHLAYCTNVHRGENWAETFGTLIEHTLRVKERAQPNGRYAIGLRLSDQASRELSDPKTLLAFQRWLDEHDCYVFTVNGFPFGQFHGTRVKENVYLPDWTDPQRLNYTTRLFDLLAQLVPPGVEGSVSTLPGSFKDFIKTPDQERAIRDSIWKCIEHVAKLSARTGRSFHLGLEPEPFGYFENSPETVKFFHQLRDEHPNDPRLNTHLGVNYDTCHFAIEFEEAHAALAHFQQHHIRISKIHLSNALKLRPTPPALKRLAAFADDIYLHQVIVHHENGTITKFRDLAPALNSSLATSPAVLDEWRVHFHVPLQMKPTAELDTTADHVDGILNCLSVQPSLCSHLEMETYTWAVLPEPLRSRDVTDQIVAEYDWTLSRLAAHGLR